MPSEILICTATELESALLREHYEVLVTGIGAVNMAHALTRTIERRLVQGTPPQAILVCGIAGAYPSSTLAIGDVACASSECYADLGADSPDGFLDLQGLGFPLIAGANGAPPIYNELPLQLFPCPRHAKFATVNTATGRDETAAGIARRTGAEVESMEGAAAVHVARLYGIPIGEIRGISNRAGLRDRASWRVKEAAEAAQHALLAWLKQQR